MSIPLLVVFDLVPIEKRPVFLLEHLYAAVLPLVADEIYTLEVFGIVAGCQASLRDAR